MPMTTIAFGVALIAQGLAGYLTSGKASKTALIPAVPGGLLALLGALAHRPASRGFAMHAAVAVAALGVVAALIGGVPRHRTFGRGLPPRRWPPPAPPTWPLACARSSPVAALRRARGSRQRPDHRRRE
jgi:uncharacterized membrane protein (UPF0136 family)